MFDLIQAGEHTYYIENPARVGIYLDGTDAWLIDSGYSDTAAELIFDIIAAHKWSLKGIVVTHSHPDHSGGCSWLQQKTGCSIFAHGLEAALIQHPVVHPSISYGGYPSRSIRGRGMMAAQCTAEEMTGNIPSGLEIIPLPGHFFDMVGIRTSDDIIFPADSICSEVILKRYGITFLYDAEAYVSTLEKIAAMKAALFVPSHVIPVNDIRELAALNKANVLSVADNITGWCTTPVTFEKLLQKVFTGYRRTMNFEQYCLVGSTLRSYLAWLKNCGRVQTAFSDNKELWYSTPIS
ncbi:MAG: MBL fold metallo-hydrolase [Treponema sp.]|nr:MBL fold metallo-hydrolase [Treponema sp.]